MSTNRSEKIADLLKKEVSLIISNEIKDPRLKNINVTAVKVSDDIGIATIFYTVIGKSVKKNDSEIDNEILKKLTLNPDEEDEFIDKDISIRDYLNEILNSFKEISTKNFIFNFDQDSNSKKIVKSIEIVYGLRNFIGNANKFSDENIFINLKSDSEFTEISIEDDGPGYPKDILSKIGEPYLKSNNPQDKSKTGLGLGLFIGKTLLEKNFASVICRNSKTRSGAEVIIKWKNKNLFNIQ